jgi:hypothetical protein
MALHNVQQLSDAYDDLLKRVEKLEAYIRASSANTGADARAEAVRRAREGK